MTANARSIPRYDIVIVGAGPAGLAAAGAATSAAGTTAPSVLVIDSADQPGGQFWRHRSETTVADDGRLHHGWQEYLDLRADFDAGIAAGSLTYLPSTSVWMVKRVDGEGFALYTAPSHGPGSSNAPIVRAPRLIIATGGYDRQLPVPGWDLPGVMAAGGIQAFAKQNGMLPGRRFLIAGTGPFLLPVAATVADLGGTVAAVLESSHLSAWLPRAHRVAGVPEKALEGAGYAWTFAKNRIPYRTRTIVTEILGEERVEAVRTARLDRLGEVVKGSTRIVEGIDAVGLGWGFTPQLELPVSLGVETALDADGSLIARVDDRQCSSVPGLFLAGELTGVGGATLAVAEGRIAGLAAAAEVAGSSAQTALGSRTDRKTILRHRRFAQAMHLSHPIPPRWENRLGEDTIVCRCEEVSSGEIIAARETMSANDARTQKSLTRAGMGWCQGRVCGFAVSCLAASPVAGSSAGESAAESSTGSMQASLTQTMKRPVAQPVPMSTFLDL